MYTTITYINSINNRTALHKVRIRLLTSLSEAKIRELSSKGGVIILDISHEKD